MKNRFPTIKIGLSEIKIQDAILEILCRLDLFDGKSLINPKSIIAYYCVGKVGAFYASLANIAFYKRESGEVRIGLVEILLKKVKVKHPRFPIARRLYLLHCQSDATTDAEPLLEERVCEIDF